MFVENKCINGVQPFTLFHHINYVNLILLFLCGHALHKLENSMRAEHFFLCFCRPKILPLNIFKPLPLTMAQAGGHSKVLILFLFIHS